MVLLVAQNSIAFAAVILGILWTGATISTANPNYTETELGHQLRDSGAKVVFTSNYDTVAAPCKKAGIHDASIISVGPKQQRSKNPIQHWSEIGSEYCTSCSRPIIHPKSDVAFLMYSSGTTGLPKGVMLSHYNIVSSTMQIECAEQGNLTWNSSKTVPGTSLPPNLNGDVVLACLPFFHIYGLTHMVLQPLYKGWKCVVMQNFEIDKWCRTVERYRATYAYIVPTIALLLANDPTPGRYDLSTIRFANSGAAPLPADLVAKVQQKTAIRIKQSYGLTEASPSVAALRWQDWSASESSSGRFLPNIQARFVKVPDTEDMGGSQVEEVAPGQAGELQLQAPNIFIGYHGKPDITSSSFTKDGWFKTGDVGYLDNQGNLHITDRIKEMIKYKGFQVAPAELESVLRSHPLVSDVAVVGVKDMAQATELARAYIVPSKRLSACTHRDAEEISDWLAKRLVRYKKLYGGVRFVDSIPRNPAGKILRRTLSSQAVKEDSGSAKANL